MTQPCIGVAAVSVECKGELGRGGPEEPKVDTKVNLRTLSRMNSMIVMKPPMSMSSWDLRVDSQLATLDQAQTAQSSGTVGMMEAMKSTSTMGNMLSRVANLEIARVGSEFARTSVANDFKMDRHCFHRRPEMLF